MKKTILILVVLALLVPVAAFGATEFSLGGYIKLDSFWDSTQEGKNMAGAIARNNNPQFHHGHFTMTAQSTRFNFTIKGPKLWGATTTGFIEMDFDSNTDGRFSATNSYTPRLRHAMFRLNWPETELMFGQYWGMFSEYGPEAVQDSAYNNFGSASARAPQIRLTQKFAGSWTVAGAVLKPYDPTAGATGDANFDATTSPNQYPGGSSETPQLMGKIAYEKDLWGKAPFFGRPRGFAAQVTGGWQRTRYQSNSTAATFSTFGQNAFGTTGATAFQNGQQYLDPWMVQGNLFIPVLTTHSANLAGTASLSAQWFIGQGLSAFGEGLDTDNSWFKFSGLNALGQQIYNRRLTNQFGGYLQGQYWFTNEWFLNAVWGMQRNYGFDRSQYASNNDQAKLAQQVNLTLWYRPIEALKFGLQYSYVRTDWLQNLNNPTIAGIAPPASAGATNVGEAHRIEFVAFMYF